MNRIMPVMKLHMRDKLSWIYVPWMILGFSFLVNIITSYFVTDHIYTGGILTIYVFMFVSGIVVLVQTFPFALGLSVRRTDYYIGTYLHFLVISFFNAIILLLFSLLESELIVGWGTDLYFFHLPYLNDGSIVEQFLIYFLIMIHLLIGGLIFSSVFRRFGKFGLLTFGIVLFVTSSIVSFLITRNQWWDKIWIWLVNQTAFELALWTIPLTLIYTLANYIMIRKAIV
jgi:hypothetical protein